MDEHAYDLLRTSVDEAQRSKRSILERQESALPPQYNVDGIVEQNNALYYKAHTKTALPKKGKLLLAVNAGLLSFQCKDYVFTWDLEAIRVEKFQGRVHRGMKVLGRRRAEGAYDRGRVRGTVLPPPDGQREEDEYTFTNVSHFYLYLIQSAIKEKQPIKEKKVKPTDGN